MLENLFNPLEFLTRGLKSTEENLKELVERTELNSEKRGYVRGSIMALNIWKDCFTEDYSKKNKTLKRFSEGIDKLAQKYSQYL